jgi:hypothetical protein
MRNTSIIRRATGALAVALAALLATGPDTQAEARAYAGSYDGPMYVPAPAKSRAGLRVAVKRSGYAANKRKGKRYAARGGSRNDASPYRRSVTGGGGVRWIASAACLNGHLRSVVAGAAAYGSVTVSSTCRSQGHNRRVGGAKKSHHLTGNAVDFRVHGNWRAAYAYLRSSGLGGLKHYGGGLFHADTGPKRSW